MSRPERGHGTLLIMAQAYPPDPNSGGQHLHDVASEMVRRGHRVLVLTANRGYENASIRLPRRQVLDGVEIHRLPLSSFGKASLFTRLLGGVTFVLQCMWRGLITRRLVRILAGTSPPMISMAVLVIAAVRRVPVTYWILDLNPDQSVAVGWIKPTSPAVRALDRLNRRILRRAERVIVLDRYMAERVVRKLDVGGKLSVIPPWPYDSLVEPIEHEVNPFRRRHAPTDRLVFMYSGNHTPVHPLTTLLDAAHHFQSDPRVLFMFVGGGQGKEEVERARARQRSPNILSLPYQPLADLKFSLSAADVHVISMGAGMVGICHPCKVYGAMAVARPLLLFGPRQCHLGEIIDRYELGWRVDHGDVGRAVETISAILAKDPTDLKTMGRRGRDTIAAEFSQHSLRSRLCDRLEDGSAGTTVQ